MDAAQIEAAYAAQLQETITVRRYTGAAGTSRTYVEMQVRGRAWGYSPDELVGTIQQGDVRALLLKSDMTETGFSHPLKSGDKIIADGKQLNVQAVSTRKARDGTVIVYDVQARG